MKVCLVNGSPHKEGCTYTALSEVARTLEEENIAAEIFWIGNKPLGGCTACGGCASLGRCVFDDAVNDFRARIKEFDGFVFGSPVYYASVAGNMKAFMDRLFHAESLSNGSWDFYLKPAAAVISARRAGTTAAFDELNKYLTISQMPVVSSRYWNMVHGNNAAEVLQDKEGLYTMRVLGRNMAYLLKCIEAGRRAGLDLPAQEPVVTTNFVR